MEGAADDAEAPALGGWLASGSARLGDLLRNPEDRDDSLHVVPLLVLRGDEATLAPDGDFVLAAGDELLLAGRPGSRRALDTTLFVPSVLEYVAPAAGCRRAGSGGSSRGPRSLDGLRPSVTPPTPTASLTGRVKGGRR